MMHLLLLQLAVTWTVQVSASAPRTGTPIQPYTITRVTTLGAKSADVLAEAVRVAQLALCDQPSPFTRPYDGVYTQPPKDAINPEQVVFDDPVLKGRICILDIRLLVLFLPRGDWVLAVLQPVAVGPPIKQIAPMFTKQ